MIAYRVGRRVGRGGHAAWGTWIVRIAGLLAFALPAARSPRRRPTASSRSR